MRLLVLLALLGCDESRNRMRPDAGPAPHDAIDFDTSGGGFFEPEILVEVGAPTIRSTADLNGDGRSDLLLSSGGSSTRTIEVRFGNADRTFSAAATSDGGPVAELVLADFTGDQQPDIVTSAYSNATFRALRATAPGVFESTPTLYMSPAAGPSLAIGTFDADPHADLLVVGDMLHLATGNGTGAFTGASTTPGLSVRRNVLRPTSTRTDVSIWRCPAMTRSHSCSATATARSRRARRSPASRSCGNSSTSSRTATSIYC